MIKYNGVSKVLRDIHRVRKDISRETKGMTAIEEIRYWRRIAEEGLKETGYEYIIIEGKKVLKKRNTLALLK
ncbi:MAG: hypothetical protein QME07_02705 [bacterium]|nr:hypothetical protein [bacterium]